MTHIDNISIGRFRLVFTKLGWHETIAKSGKYAIWTDPQNSENWTLLPLDESTDEYAFYQRKNIDIILFALSLPESDDQRDEIYSQLKRFNYKLINRIVVAQNDENQNAVPYELANALIYRNIDSFRSFYIQRKGRLAVTLDKFELNHTRHGSFIIPVSFLAEEQNGSLPTIPSITNSIVRDYLDMLTNLTEIQAKNEDEYAHNVIEAGINSGIVKNFYDPDVGFAKYREKYAQSIDQVSVTSVANPILDFKLTEKDKTFKVISLEDIKPIPQSYIQTLVNKEVEMDKFTIEAENADIEAVVDVLDWSRKAQFTVLAINGKEVDKQFKAKTVELSKESLSFCTQAFDERKIIKIRGDITKPKGKVGTIYATSFDMKPVNVGLFDAQDDS
ncbi:MAG: hypothetical protein UX62_C0039G0005 [Microgenomates group bacterium GW2011_GWA2_46_7]|nr:MAG: hypothetical protein UX62_C0039G0005 [Microgenomates group bacterium GW2011_GWA2_46_7]